MNNTQTSEDDVVLLSPVKLLSHFFETETSRILSQVRKYIASGRTQFPKSLMRALQETTTVSITQLEWYYIVGFFSKSPYTAAGPLNVDVGMGANQGEICNRESAVRLFAAFIRQDKSVPCVVSGAISYIESLK